ncbi:MAG: 3-oxoacyl-[acyl-carrier-protein] synthase III [Candidatus Binatia bacterium]|jgi:3-oxoacyl-[acyl-carrier-protein] synthase III
MKDALSILGTGVYLPPARPVRDVVAEAGGDSSIFQGWDNVCHALDEDHPSTMGADALRRALDDSGVNTADLKLVIFAGMSRDYLPSYSVATEVMKTCDVPGGCVGIDITIGCLGALSALDLAHGWLAVRGGGLAAVVTAERWSYTVDHSSAASYGLWAHADGAAAAVVGMNTEHTSKGQFAGAETVTQSDLNGSIIVKYGGTRNPVAPAGINPAEREILTLEGIDRRDRYAQGYSASFQAMQKRFGVRPNRVICNQTAVPFLQLIASVIEIPVENFLVTGHETGHVGSADILIGLDRLLKSEDLTEPYLMAGSTPFAFASGLLMPD